MPGPTSSEREVLPIPDRAVRRADHVRREGSRQRSSRRSSRCGRPQGAPNVLIVLLDDAGFGCVERVRRARATRRPPSGSPANGLKYNRFHTTALCSPTRAALLTGRNHHSVGMGGDHRDRDLGARLQLGAPEHVRAAGRDAEAERLLDRAVRQVPRGAGVGDEPDGPVRLVADRRRRVRVLLRLHRRRDEPVLPGALRGHDPGRARRRRRRRATTSPRT